MRKIKSKTIVKWLCVALTFIFLVGLMPQNTQAAYVKYLNRIETLPEGKTVTTTGERYENSTYTNTGYKIKVPANGYLTISSNSKENLIGITTNVEKKMDSSSQEQHLGDLLNGAKTYKIVLKKGTYYLYTLVPAKIKWTFTKVENPSNKTKARAKTLNQSKAEKVVLNYGKEYDRWYKINLTKKQKIKVTVKCANVFVPGLTVFICDASGKGLGYEFSYSKDYSVSNYQTRSAMKKGTYYIKIICNTESIFPQNRVCTLSWK